MIDKAELLKLYVTKRQSMQQIADSMDCSLHKIKYWIDRHGIATRSMSEAIYSWHNPNGDPFKFMPPRNTQEAIDFGVGIGLYWGEGTKADKGSVRLGNSNPKIIEDFMNFLTRFFSVKKKDFHFSLQLFSDIDESEALDFWMKKLKINKAQFYKTYVTISGSIGTYRVKSQYGVVTVYYHNKKLRDLLVGFLPM